MKKFIQGVMVTLAITGLVCMVAGSTVEPVNQVIGIFGLGLFIPSCISFITLLCLA